MLLLPGDLVHGRRVQDVQLAADGTRKLVSVLTSGEGAGKNVETVIIPMLRYEFSPARVVQPNRRLSVKMC